jgi:hypothetical protein
LKPQNGGSRVPRPSGGHSHAFVTFGGAYFRRKLSSIEDSRRLWMT